MKLAFLFFFLFISPFTIQAQEINLNSIIIDEFGIPINDCSITIKGNKSKLIYSYFVLAGKNTFNRNFVINKDDDSLKIGINHITYTDTTIAIAVKNQKQNLVVKLHVKSNFLKDVNIKGPPIWKRGDTTNFRADAFKEGDEKKLKDVLEKIPGFEISEEGKLTYNRKPINKIRVDNEDLFSDKVKLLLNSFPSHVIDLVQVQENQSENKLLSGISGNETFLNLTLKKGTIKAGFGDFEMGFGTKKRYLASPVLFSISNKIKAGYVGNINSLGDGVDWKLDSEIKNEHEQLGGQLLMTNYPLSLINNVLNRYYIRNNLFDNRIDINAPISKKTHSKTEVSYISDHQQQSTITSTNYYNGQSFLNREENNLGTYKPRLLNIKQTVNYDIDTASNLKTVIGWFSDHTHGNQQSNYLQSGSLSVLENGLINNWDSFSLESEYTHRTNASSANLTSIKFNTQKIDQSAEALSLQWPAIFNSPNSDYVLLNQHLDDRLSTFLISHKRFISTKKQRIEWNISYQISEMKLDGSTNFTDLSDNLTPISPVDFGRGHSYLQNKIVTSVDGRLIRKKDFSVSYKIEAGLNRSVLKEAQTYESFIIPLINTSLIYVHKIHTKASGFLTISYNQNAYDITKLSRIYQPKSIESYSRNATVDNGVKQISFSYNLNFIWPDVSNNSNLYFFYNYNLNNPVHINQYQNFLNFSTDSLANAGAGNFYVGTNHRFVSLFLNALIELKASAGRSTYLLLNNGGIYKTVNSTSALEIFLKRNWSKKYYITLNASYFNSLNKQPDFLLNNEIQSKSADLVTGFKQRLSIIKQTNFILDTRFVYNNLYTTYKANFLFVDAEVNFKLKNTPLFFTLRGENLANVKSYSAVYNLGDGQRISNIPLIGRNVFASVRYEL
ncbi:hypothetical protein ACFOG5_14335 [Pedobacter fastidiosus]|uniref:TonB-dependent receptor n=1 Tax=Pedobacter fastidiosus TaxID=2765361 RepID=A0ABR7KLB4_9SPHI|nr:hypothetical protein [Pedobacter fastidiosus]MBC6108793.1 hypothetical protein [Pedobacter fastidiosus]